MAAWIVFHLCSSCASLKFSYNQEELWEAARYSEAGLEPARPIPTRFATASVPKRKKELILKNLEDVP